LLKVAYNSARSNSEPVERFRPLLPYVLGQANRPPLPCTMLAGIIRADVCTERERAVLRSPYLFPRGIRLGKMDVGSVEGATFGVLCCITSHIFVVLFWDPAFARQGRRRVLTIVARRNSLVVLPEGRRTARLPEWVTSSRAYLSLNSWSPDILPP